MPTLSSNLYKKIEDLENTKPKFKQELSEDQKKIIETSLDTIEKEIALERSVLSRKAKLNPDNDIIKRDIDAISYSTINIRHIKIKLGIKTSNSQ